MERVMAGSEVDVRAWAEVLLHDAEAFTVEGIEARAEQLGEGTDKVEIFAWLLEISAQASEAVGDIIDSDENALILAAEPLRSYESGRVVSESAATWTFFCAEPWRTPNV
jgi:hypothetical protein